MSAAADLSGCVFRGPNYLRIITPEYMRKLEEPCPCGSAECDVVYKKEKEMYDAAIHTLRGLVLAQKTPVKASGESGRPKE